MLGINEPPVTIKQIEKTIVDHAFEEGWIQPEPPAAHRQDASRSSAPVPRDWPPRSNWRAPVTRVTVFEKADRIGGLLRYGIPDFKMEKRLIDRRLEQMVAEGVEFRTDVNVGANHQRRPICSTISMPFCWPAAPNIRAICRCPAAS